MSDTTLLQQLEKELGSQYVIERELGGGGMSRVFLATEISLQRKVVIKVLPPDLAATVNVERFRREIQLSAQLQHPLIVPVLSSGIMNGLPYYTMPFIEGESLRAKLARDRELPLGEAVRIMRDVVSALSYAHEKGVVHRDIKPDNVMLTRHHAVVTDFGVAKALSAATNPGSSLTSMGVALGTPAYMSPEQATADPNTDHRADIYAVGATAYEMITGRQLFSGRSPQAMLAAQAVEQPEAIEKHRPSVSPVLSTLIMRTLEKHAADRPQTADELLHVLDALATPSGGMTPTMSLPVAAASKGNNRRIVIGGAVGLLILAAAAMGARRIMSRPAAANPDKVIVAPFQNKTGDKKFDQLGTVATDWISRGIVETGVVDIGQFTPQKDASGRVAENAFEIPILVKQALALSAGRIVSGSYYMQSDTLQFQAQIVDANDGKLIGSVPPTKGPVGDPMPAINELRARVMGALAQMSGTERSGLSSVDAPPSYDAFREFTRGQEAFERGDYRSAIVFYAKASAIDTSYYAPVVRAAYAHNNIGNCYATDSIGVTLNAKRERLSDYEGYYLDRVLAWCRGDWNAAYAAAKQVARVAPKSSSAAYIAARSAPPINRLNEAAEAFRKLDINKPHSSQYYPDYSQVLHMLRDYEGELAVVRAGRKLFPDRLAMLAAEVSAMAALNRVDDVRRAVSEAMTMRGDELTRPDAVLLAAASELAAHGHPAEAREVAGELVSLLKRRDAQLPWSRRFSIVSDPPAAALASALLLAGRTSEARSLADSLLRTWPKCVECMSISGQASAMLGDRVEAEQASASLLALKTPYLIGVHTLAAAKIAARLGQKSEAVQLLRESIGQGTQYPSFNDAMDAFLSLRGYSPFEQLLKSKD